MDGATRVADLDTELQLMTAFLTDPGFRPDIDAQLPTAIELRLPPAQGRPARRRQPGALEAPCRGRTSPRCRREADAARISSADFARLLGPALKNDALEVTVVGDIDEATRHAAAGRDAGRDPAAPAERPRAAGRAAWFAIPAAAPPPIHVTHEGPADKAAVLMTWPLFVWTPDTIREQRTIELLGRHHPGRAHRRSSAASSARPTARRSG